MSSAKFTRQFSYQFCTPITGGAHESWTLVGSVDTSFEVALDTDYALIVKIGNTGDMSAIEDFKLQYNVSGAGWNDVNASSSNVRTAASGDTDDATSATERLTTSARSFQASTLDEGDGANILNISGSNDVEFYFALNFRSADLTAGEESITFKVVDAGGDIDAYDITPTATLPALSSDVTEDPLLGELDLLGYVPISFLPLTEAPGIASPSPTITGYAPTVAIAKTALPTLGTLSLSGKQAARWTGLWFEGYAPTATVGAPSGNTEEPLLGTLALSGIVPTVVTNHIAAPTVGSLALGVAGNDPEPIQGQVEQPLLGTLALGIAGSAPTAVVANVTLPTIDTLALTGSVPTVSVGEVELPTADTLVLDGKTPTVQHNRLADVPLDALDLSGIAPTAAVGDIREPAIDELALSGIAPTVVVATVIEPAIDELAFTGYAPTTGAADTVEPTLETLALSGAIPTVVVATVIEPGTDALVLSGKVPTTGATKTALPTIDALALSGAAPTTVVANNIPVGLGTLTLSGKLPDIPSGATVEIPTGSLNIYQYVGLKLDGFPPTVSFAETVEPSVGSLTLSGKIPTLNITVAPTVGALTLSGKVPKVLGAVSPGTGSLVLQGYTPADQDTVIPGVGSLTLSGKGITLKGIESPTTAALTLSGQALTVEYSQEPDPTTGSLALSGVAPTIAVANPVSPTTGALTLSGSIPEVGADSIITLKGALALSGSAPTASVKSLPTAGSDALAITGQTPTITVDVPTYTASPGTGSLVLFSTVKVAEPSAPALLLQGQPVSIFYRDGTLIENANATTDVPSNYEQCDFTGFRQLPGSLKMTWNKHAVRKKSWEERHPQDTLQSVPERQKGSKRPEQDDTFIDTLYPDGVDRDDL